MRVILFFLLYLLFQNADAQIDATTDEVKTINNVVYKNNRPFTGTLYQDAPNANNTCKCTIESTYLDGYLNGKKTEYHNTGVIKFIGHFKNGVEYGDHTFYNENGKVEMQIFYSNGIEVYGKEKDDAEQKMIENIMLVEIENEQKAQIGLVEPIKTIGLEEKKLENDNIIQPINPSKPEIDEIEMPSYWPEMTDVPPMAAGCEGLTEMPLASCTYNSIYHFLNVNIDKQSLGQQGIPIGSHKVLIKFIISDKGVVRNILIGTSLSEVEKEFIRVLQLLPTFKPGQKNGHFVNVKYQFETVLTLN